MKDIIIKVGAIVSIGTGFSMLVQPVLASDWPKCIGGGFTDVKNFSSCRLNIVHQAVNPANGNPSDTYTVIGDCGGRTDPKGYYCAKQTQTPTQCNELPDKQVHPLRYDGYCQLRYLLNGISVKGGTLNRYGNSPGATIPPLEDPPAVVQQLRAQCVDNGRVWYPSSGVITNGQCS